MRWRGLLQTRLRGRAVSECASGARAIGTRHRARRCDGLRSRAVAGPRDAARSAGVLLVACGAGRRVAGLCCWFALCHALRRLRCGAVSCCASVGDFCSGWVAGRGGSPARRALARRRWQGRTGRQPGEHGGSHAMLRRPELGCVGVLLRLGCVVVCAEPLLFFGGSLLLLAELLGCVAFAVAALRLYFVLIKKNRVRIAWTWLKGRDLGAIRRRRGCRV